MLKFNDDNHAKLEMTTQISQCMQGHGDQTFWIVILNPVGGYDCGLFALASACAICNGQDPSTIRFDQAMMWQHLIDGLSNKLLTPFPGKIKRHVKKLVPTRTEVVKVYCTCRLPDDGRAGSTVG